VASWGRGGRRGSPGTESGKRELGRGLDGPRSAPAGATPWVAVPGPQRLGSGGGRPAPFVRVFQAGRLPPFPLPEFSFSVGEAPAQLEGEGVGEGVPGAGRPRPRWPDTLSPHYPCPLQGRVARRTARLGTAAPGMLGQRLWSWDHNPVGGLPSLLSRLTVGGSAQGARGITQRWAALLGFFHLPAAEAGERPAGASWPPSPQQGQSPTSSKLCCQLCSSTPAHSRISS
jgi:hypothetical protein